MNIWNIFEYTAVVSVVGLLILGMKRLFRDKLDARWHYFIWLVLLVRMIVPVDFDLVRTPLSVFQQLPVEKWLEKAEILAARQGLQGIFEVLGKVYPIGVIALAAVYLVSWMVLWVRILRAPEADMETYTYVKDIAEKYHLKGCRRIRICEGNTPYIFGVVSPVLVLPVAMTRPQEEIIVHELLHMRCKDVLINLALHVVRVVNWFNPLVWKLCAVVQNDSEALCDQRVLERCGREKAGEYGEMLICMTAGKRYNPVKIGTSNMAGTFRNMKTRIERIRDFARVPVGIGFVTLCITLILTVASIGSSAEEYGSLKTPIVHSRRDLEQGLLEARCYHAPTPHQAVYLFLRSVMERNLFYRMAVVPSEHAEGLENFARACFETDLVHDEDYGSVETWDPQAYSPYYPLEMNGLERFTVYNLQYDETTGQATVVAELSKQTDVTDYVEWKLQLKLEDGWKVWLAEESEKKNEQEDGEYVPEPILYGSTMLGDFKVEILAYNEGQFLYLNNRNYSGFFSHSVSKDETFPLFYSMEYYSKRLYLTYMGDEDLTGKSVRVETAASLEELDNVSLVANIKDALPRILAEAERKSEETGDKFILEDAQNLVNEVRLKVVGNEELTAEELQEIGELLGVSVKDGAIEDSASQLDRDNTEGYIDWTNYLYGSSSSSDGRSYHNYAGEKMMNGNRKLLAGGGGGYDEPGHGWTAEDEVGAYVRIYVDGELVQEGSVWSQSH